MGSLTVMFETMENEKNNLLNRVLNFIDSNHKYIKLDKYRNDEISLTNLTLYFNQFSQYLDSIVNENQNIMHKNNCLEEEILRLKKQIDYLKQDISEIR